MRILDSTNSYEKWKLLIELFEQICDGLGHFPTHCTSFSASVLFLVIEGQFRNSLSLYSRILGTVVVIPVWFIIDLLKLSPRASGICSGTIVLMATGGQEFSMTQ